MPAPSAARSPTPAPLPWEVSLQPDPVTAGRLHAALAVARHALRARPGDPGRGDAFRLEADCWQHVMKDSVTRGLFRRLDDRPREHLLALYEAGLPGYVGHLQDSGGHYLARRLAGLGAEEAGVWSPLSERASWAGMRPPVRLAPYRARMAAWVRAVERAAVDRAAVDRAAGARAPVAPAAPGQRPAGSPAEPATSAQDTLRAALRQAPWHSPAFWSMVLGTMPEGVLDAGLVQRAFRGLTSAQARLLWQAVARRSLGPVVRGHVIRAVWAHVAQELEVTPPERRFSRLLSGVLAALATDPAWHVAPWADEFWRFLHTACATPSPARGPAPAPAPRSDRSGALGALSHAARLDLRGQRARAVLLRLLDAGAMALDVIGGLPAAVAWPRFLAALDAGSVPDAVWVRAVRAPGLDVTTALDLLARRPSHRVRLALAQHPTLGRAPALRARLIESGRSAVLWSDLARSSTDPEELSRLLCYLAPVQPAFVAERLATAPEGTRLPSSVHAQLLATSPVRADRRTLLQALGRHGVAGAPAPSLPPRRARRSPG